MTVLNIRSFLIRKRSIWALMLISSLAQAGPRERAKKMHDRLTGMPPSAQMIDEMAKLIGNGNLEAAAKLAIETPQFYSLGLRTWFSTWTNIDQSNMAPLNDYSATLIGVIRDDIPFNKIFSQDIIYVGNSEGLTPYSPINNTHYQEMQDRRVDLKASLQKVQQSTLTGVSESAGVMTTRGFGEAFYSAGTNRRAVRFTFMNYLCRDMEQMSDTTRADFRIRQDVDRSPGGDSTIFRSRCAGCHAGMDALAGAFANYNFAENKVVNTPGQVNEKYFINDDIFPNGYRTTNDSWLNLWNEGQNASIGWRGANSGSGASELGEMLAQTKAFSSCMATRVFTRVCLRAPSTQTDKNFIGEATKAFEDSNYSMKGLFNKAAVYCTAE